MSDLQIAACWQAVDDPDAVAAATSGRLRISVGHSILTRSVDAWSKTVSDHVLVSCYPLAGWIANCWWRLCYEPAPSKIKPTHAWRMSHVLTAAGGGYVWPSAVFVPEGDQVLIASIPEQVEHQSVSYVGPPTAERASLSQFEAQLSSFVDDVLARATAMGHGLTDLHELWCEVQLERQDPTLSRKRRVEAMLGFDPEECPPWMMLSAHELESLAGERAINELLPAVAGGAREKALTELKRLPGTLAARGFPAPELGQIGSKPLAGKAPWERGHAAAQAVRATLSFHDAVSSETLLSALGLPAEMITREPSAAIPTATVALAEAGGMRKYVTRKNNALGKRFEYARLVGDVVYTRGAENVWLAATDMTTSRQRFQRAFAAELLCPLDDLLERLGGDYSEEAQESAAAHFEVSPHVVLSKLRNSGYLQREDEDLGTFWRLAA